MEKLRRDLDVATEMGRRGWQATRAAEEAERRVREAAEHAGARTVELGNTLSYEPAKHNK